MTAPKPPETESFIQWGVTEMKAAQLELSRTHLAYHIVLAAVALAFAFAGYEGWQYHRARVALLESQNSALVVAKKNEDALVESWKKRALANVAQFRVDTVKVQQLVTRVRVDTMLVHVVDSAGVQSEVPIAVVSKLDFDSLGAMCERTQHDCASAIASKDSVIAHTGTLLALSDSIASNYEQQLGVTKRANFWTKLGFGGGGFGLGFTAGYATGSASCHK